jgi:hypothetical protein
MIIIQSIPATVWLKEWVRRMILESDDRDVLIA